MKIENFSEKLSAFNDLNDMFLTIVPIEISNNRLALIDISNQIQSKQGTQVGLTKCNKKKWKRSADPKANNAGLRIKENEPMILVGEKRNLTLIDEISPEVLCSEVKAKKAKFVESLPSLVLAVEEANPNWPQSHI